MLSQSEKDNRPHWNFKQRGFYEVWYFKFNVPGTQQAFWFRYTLSVPTKETAIAELWAIAFNIDGDNHRAWKETFPIADYKSNPKGFNISIGDSFLSHSHCCGSMQQNGSMIEWDLSYEPNHQTYHHMLPLLRKAPFPKTKVCTPHINIFYNGTITVDGVKYLIQQAPGMQGHIWGKQHAHSWVWSHCNLIEGHSNVYLEALSARVKFGSLLSPPLTPIFIHYKGEDYFCNGYEDLVKNVSFFRPGSWNFTATHKDRRFLGLLTADLREDAVGVKYTDPDGSFRYCYNTKIGDLRLEIQKRVGKSWQIEEVLDASGTTAIEWVVSEPIQDIPISI